MRSVASVRVQRGLCAVGRVGARVMGAAVVSWQLDAGDRGEAVGAQVPVVVASPRDDVQADVTALAPGALIRRAR